MSAVPQSRRPAAAPEPHYGREGIVLRIPPSAFTLNGFREWLDSDEVPEKMRATFISGEMWLDFRGTDFDVHIPANAHTIRGFREWVQADDFPENMRVTFLNGEIILDMSQEELETHNKVKMEVMVALANLDRDAQIGTLYADGARITDNGAGVSNDPDGVYVSWKSRKAGKVRFVKRKGKESQYVEIEGAPDWVMEVVSDDSVTKDKKELRGNYHKAGIREYWLIDARGKEIDFQILVWHKKGYTAALNKAGWQRSPVFGRFFRLTRKKHADGDWLYRLETHDESP